jgi:hypothetical protein
VRRFAAAIGVGVLAAALVIGIPGAGAKKHRHKRHGVGGKVSVNVPAFDPDTGTSLATGKVHAKHGCDAPRVVRFAFFTSAGQPIQTGQPAVVTTPGGGFVAALPSPGEGDTPIVVKTAVDARTVRNHGSRVRCRALRGPNRTIAPTQPRRNG